MPTSPGSDSDPGRNFLALYQTDLEEPSSSEEFRRVRLGSETLVLEGGKWGFGENGEIDARVYEVMREEGREGWRGRGKCLGGRY